MNIIKATPYDGYDIERLVMRCADHSGTMMITSNEASGSIAKTVLSPNCFSYVARMDGDIIGVIMGISGVTESSKHNIEVMMCVDPKWCRMGIGSMLMHFFLLEHGWMNVFAEVVAGNVAIMKLLRSHNYELVCSLPKFVKTGDGFKDKLIYVFKG